MTTPKTVVLIRHPESTKNLSDQFANDDGQEIVTDLGYEQIAQLSTELSSALAQKNCNNVSVVVADTARSLPCGLSIANDLKVPLRREHQLVSIGAGKIAGVSETLVSQSMPEYYERLTMYRRGVLSSYDLDHPGENLHDFEDRISASLKKIEADDNEVVIVCAHKSAITAALIRYARMYHNYPLNFFGFVDIPLASSSIINVRHTGGAILCVGINSDRLTSYL